MAPSLACGQAIWTGSTVDPGPIELNRNHGTSSGLGTDF
jgi:hypothetical protein